MSGPDLYAVLGVEPEASGEELAAAYRRRARLTHPDVGGDALAFRAVQHAFEILSDAGLRAGYDAERGTPAAPPADPATDRFRDPHGAAAETGSSSGAAAGDGQIDVGQIPWAAGFADLDEADLEQVRVVPGQWWWVARLMTWLVMACWLLAGVWIGVDRATPVVFGWAVWVLAWWTCTVIVAVHAARGRWSVLIALSAVLAWPAYTDPGQAWSWVVYGWLAGATVLPTVRAAMRRPMWSQARTRAGTVFGEPSWDGAKTAPTALGLTIIPGVRVFHRVPYGEHAVVLDRRIAIIAGSELAEIGNCEARSWPAGVADDPQRAVAEIGAWLLGGNDGWTVDRRVLALAAGQVHNNFEKVR